MIFKTHDKEHVIMMEPGETLGIVVQGGGDCKFVYGTSKGIQDWSNDPNEHRVEKFGLSSDHSQAIYILSEEA